MTDFRATRTCFPLAVLLWITCASAMPAGAQMPAVDPARFGALTCQQFWYAEQETLADGRVCLRTERARRAFNRWQKCISDDEAILPKRARAYLQQLRTAARERGCRGF